MGEVKLTIINSNRFVKNGQKVMKMEILFQNESVRPSNV